MSDPQRQLDTRALEIAKSADARVDGLERQLIRHEDRCFLSSKENGEKLDRLSQKIEDGLTALHEKIDSVKDRSTNWWKSALVWIIAALVAMVAVLLMDGVPFVRKASAHGEHNWMRSYSNGKISCCDERDIAYIPHWDANGLQVGDSYSTTFPTGPKTVTVLKIYPTEDKRGRAAITAFGCLFRSFGT